MFVRIRFQIKELVFSREVHFNLANDFIFTKSANINIFFMLFGFTMLLLMLNSNSIVCDLLTKNRKPLKK